MQSQNEQQSYKKKLIEHLEKRKAQGTLRSLQVPQTGIDFLSNDYLGLARSIEFQQFLKQTYENYAADERFLNGSTGSRLLGGNAPYFEEFEPILASRMQGETALIFPSGYIANMAFLGSIPQKNDIILLDEFAHASMFEGARLSFAKRIKFKHNCLNDLKKQLAQHKTAENAVYVITESLFSMEGDFAPIKEMLGLCSQYEALLYVDEAHTSGWYNAEASSYCGKMLNKQELKADNLVRLYTFGKALSVGGACIIAPQWVKEYLINYAKAFIYTTAPNAQQVIEMIGALNFLKTNSYSTAYHQFIDLISYWSAVFNAPLSPIQSIQFEDIETLKKTASFLQENGYLVKPVYSPTVPEGSERLRIILHAFNTKEEISTLKKALEK